MNDPIDPKVRQPPGFQILGKLGAGTHSTVFKARQLPMDQVVAIKVLPKKLSERPEFIERFLKEGRILSRLHHINISQVIDAGEAGGYHYLVMEYIEGVTAKDYLAHQNTFSPNEALDIIIQVARALEYVTQRGFIHCDVKPKKIMITKLGAVKLIGFFLAREIQDHRRAMTGAGHAYGTPFYMSPEQIKGEIDIDFRVDMYSLGATFYHMVTGSVPFKATTPAAVMHKHLKEQLTSPVKVVPTLSANLSGMIERMMAKKREHRYASWNDLLENLESLKGD